MLNGFTYIILFNPEHNKNKKPKKVKRRIKRKGKIGVSGAGRKAVVSVAPSVNQSEVESSVVKSAVDA